MVQKHWFLQIVVACMSDSKNFIPMRIETELEVYNLMLRRIELYRMILESDLALYWMILLSVLCDVVPRLA